MEKNIYEVTSTNTFVASDNNGSIYGMNTSSESSEKSSDSDDTLTIVLAVVIGLVVLSIIVIGYFIYKRYN